MNLRYPFLLLLALVPLGLYVLKLRQNKGFRGSPLTNQPRLRKTLRVSLRYVPETLVLIMALISVVLLAGPERGLNDGDTQQDGLSMVIALDRSGSMKVLVPFGDGTTTRLDGVKAVTKDFLDQRTQDQFALVSFARYPETNTPLTTNTGIVKDLLDLLRVPDQAEEDGTAIGDALALATARLSAGLPDGGGIIILLTDGQNNRGDISPLEGARLAKEQGITIYTIGLGGEGYLVEDTPQGKRAIGVPVDINEETLTNIAQETGGTYYRAESLKDLQTLYGVIAEQETAKIQAQSPDRKQLELSWGIVAILISLLLWFAMDYIYLKRRDP